MKQLCSVCQIEFKDSKEYTAHLVSSEHQNKISAAKPKISCKKCNTSYRDKTDFIRHLKTLKHLRSIKPKKKKKEKEKLSQKFFCEHCKSSFGLSDMKNHLDKVINQDLNFERYSSGSILFVYGTSSGIDQSLSSPGFLSAIKKRVVKLIKVILSAYPLFKFSLALKSVYIKTFAIVNEKKSRDQQIGSKELIPFSTSCYNAYRGSNETKKFVTRALNEMVVREDK